MELADGAELGNRHLGERLAGEIEGAHAEGATQKLPDVEARGGRETLDHDRLGLWHHHRGLGDVGRGQRDAQHLPALGVLGRAQVEGIARTERGVLRLVREVRDAAPRPRGAEQVEGEFPAVPVRDPGQDPGAVLAALESGLGDARPVLPDRVGVLLLRRPERVVIDLLVEVQIFFGPLGATRVARVIEAPAVLVPDQGAAARSFLGARDGLVDLFPGRDLAHVDRSVLASDDDDGVGIDLEREVIPGLR